MEIADGPYEKLTARCSYKHCVLAPLIDDKLLRAVRTEIIRNINFTPKETDIYRIHQSGDLTNISGLPLPLQNKLASVAALRDALYSQQFRNFISALTGCGPLSGKKTDMAINVYTPGCHLLTHDDVIGSRRVSYILYLTDPDEPWRAEWGGALRLYPTNLKKDAAGSVTKVPSHMWCKSIPPSWNQLSFFEVVPGESFHDVEEVFDGPEERIRMAISGWFHIPQKGEDGYVPGLEDELAKKSSLQSLQSKADVFDRPQPQVVSYTSSSPADSIAAAEAKGKGKAEPEEEDEGRFLVAELDFLLKFIAPTFLTPDTLEQMRDSFESESVLSIFDFLRPQFEAALRAQIEKAEALPPLSSAWSVAVPPHKHRFLYMQPGGETSDETGDDLLKQLVNELFPSREFKKLLQLATGLRITDRNVLARRFRRGLDYTLATSFGDDDKENDSKEEGGENKFRLELCLGLTPTTGWDSNINNDDNGDHAIVDEDALSVVPDKEKEKKGESSSSSSSSAPSSSKKNGVSSSSSSSLNGSSSKKASHAAKFDDRARTIGGYSMYMSPDDDSADPAIYKASSSTGDGDDDDDGVLFFCPAAWNCLSIVLRDKGVLGFVKYVSASAKGDRWDVMAEFGVEPTEEEDDDDDEEEVEEGGEDESGGEESDGKELESGDDGEVWAGIQD